MQEISLVIVKGLSRPKGLFHPLLDYFDKKKMWKDSRNLSDVDEISYAIEIKLRKMVWGHVKPCPPTTKPKEQIRTDGYHSHIGLSEWFHRSNLQHFHITQSRIRLFKDLKRTQLTRRLLGNAKKAWKYCLFRTAF